MGRLFRWLPGLAIVGMASFALPRLGMTPEHQGMALVAFMAVIGGIVFKTARDVVLVLVDVATVFEDVTGRLDRLVLPVMAFLTYYSLLVVVFACLYRIAEISLEAPQFMVHGVARNITFVDALYFSVVTLSTVGYGDITPEASLVRGLAMIEVIAGLLLLLFGFSEIMRTNDSGRRRGPPPPHT
jgi:voltage-gated potassium channel